MEHIYSYPTVCPLGHRMITELFLDPVLVQEKIDGSQISFAVNEKGELSMRSKGKDLLIDEPEKMFRKAVEWYKANKHKFVPNWIYRGEYLQSPKHNTITYGRTPKNNIILFDIEAGIQDYLPARQVSDEGERIGLETVPTFFVGLIDDESKLAKYLELDSCLGNSKIEGIVVKNYFRFTPDKKVLMGKYVSEHFKETHEVEWRKANPTPKDVVNSLVDAYKTDARFEKAIQHLRDNGLLTETPKDIGALVREVSADIEKECADDIKDRLYSHFKSQILRGVTKELPFWYKARLSADGKVE